MLSKDISNESQFIHVFKNTQGLLGGIIISINGIITIFKRDNVVCGLNRGDSVFEMMLENNPNLKASFIEMGGIPIDNLAFTSIQEHPMYSIINCFNLNSEYGYSVIDDMHPLHKMLHPKALSSSITFSKLNSHQHYASPIIITPNILECFLSAFIEPQNDIQTRLTQLKSEGFPTLAFWRRIACRNNPRPITDITRPAVTEEDISEAVAKYKNFYQEHKNAIQHVYNETFTTKYLNQYFSTCPVEGDYLSETINYKYILTKTGEAAFSAAKTATPLSILKNTLASFTNLQESTINNIMDGIYFLLLVSDYNESADITPFLIFGINKLIISRTNIGKYTALLLTIGFNSAIEVLSNSNKTPDEENDRITNSVSAVSSTIMGIAAASATHAIISTCYSGLSIFSKRIYNNWNGTPESKIKHGSGQDNVPNSLQHLPKRMTRYSIIFGLIAALNLTEKKLI